MSTNWTAVEDAVRNWVKSASALDNAHVVWSPPNATRPTGTFITLRMGEMLTLGLDEIVGADNPSGTPGVDDYTQTVISRREFSVTIQCFAPPAAGHLGPTYGVDSARAILSRVAAARALESTRAALAAAGVSCFDVGTVTYVPELVGTVFEGRAVLTPRFYALETVSEGITYIQTVAPIGATFNH